jgi:hypothetical protein
MGKSFIEYGEHGFWSRDQKIELLLYLLAQEGRNLDNPPEWLRSASDYWQSMATVGAIGCLDAGLDQYATTPERTAIILELAERVLAGLRQRGDLLPITWLNSLGLGGPGAYFVSDCPAEMFTRTVEAFIGLLRGEIAWNAATSPVL